MAERLHITLPENLHAWVKSVALHEGRTVSNFIATKLYSIQEEYDNANQEPKDLQSLVRPKN